MSELSEKVKTWKAQHGVVVECKLGKQDVVLRIPDQADFEEVQDRVTTGKPSAAHVRNAVLNATLHPSRDEMERLMSRFPAFAQNALQQLSAEGGNDVEFVVKKD